ncbi:MAG TPA: radical SAM family heme chaperone HemW [Burkholderiales bacterium]|nr:radical SAM family heme chaperone HemW [Burkholderiales bacterium]
MRSLEPELERRYTEALLADLDAALPLARGRTIHTVFFGGGTPSLLSAAGLDRMLSGIRARLALAQDTEITLEANPGTFEAHKFAAYRALGVTRLSVGIQSFEPARLHALGRIHDAGEAYRAVEIAHAHFDDFNLDLMYALPDQTLAEAQRDIDRAIALAPPHLSAYHLTIEPNTYFHRFPPQLPDDELSATMQESIEGRLAAAGYGHYETSAFARPGRQCKHNLNYWRFGDYLGIGAGAHGKISGPQRIVREVRWRNPREYMDQALAGQALQQAQEVAAGDLPFEFMMNALRLTGGFPVALFQERTGLSSAALLPALRRAESLGLIQWDEHRVAPTLRGQRFLNDLLQLFLPEAASA